MVILQMLTFLLLALLLMGMLAKARPWTKTIPPGKPWQTISVGFLPRILEYRSSLLALFSGCLLAILAGWLPINLAAIVAAVALLILFVPMRYTFTTQGVAVGEAVFRPWSDFSGLTVGKSSLKLAASTNSGRVTLFIKPAEMDNVLKYIQRHVKSQSSNSIVEGE